MTALVDATIVTAADDWQGVYIDDTLRYQNHTASLDDVTLNDDEAIDKIHRKQYDISRLGRTDLPSQLSYLERLIEFTEEVEANYEEWADAIRTAFEDHDKDYIMTDEADEILGTVDGEGRVVFALFSKKSYRASTTPLGKTPLVEFDYENCVSGSGPAAYKLK